MILNNFSLLRFAHAFESGGGTERYLDDLDRALLERNAMTILRLHLTRQPPPHALIEESIGRGRLIRVPLAIIPDGPSSPRHEASSFRAKVKKAGRDAILYHPLVWRAFGARWVASFKLARRPGQALDAGRATAEMLRAHRVDLAMLHFFGGADAEDVIVEVKKSGIPIALLNHYSNDRFQHLAIRKHTLLADAVAGVNGLDVPSYLRDRFSNLSDGIDTDFFRRSNARPLPNAPHDPVILLPARLLREKGQLDLVRAVAALRDSGLACHIVFAGRVDSGVFLDELRVTVARAGLTELVHFAGTLSLSDLRDWYGVSAVMTLPTYNEGLPRILLEAQAMEVPVVAYATGGVPDGIESGKTGFLVPTGDVRQLTARLRELLQSPSLRSSMGAAGRVAAEARFSLSALAERHELFYAQVIAQARHSRQGRSIQSAPSV